MSSEGKNEKGRPKPAFQSGGAESEQTAAANGAVDQLQFFQRQLGVIGVHIDHHIADLVVGLQVLAGDVDAVFGEHGVDLAQHAGDVLVYVQQAMLVRVLRQCHFREVDRGDGRAVVAVLDQLFGHFITDVFLCFHGGAAHMRGQDNVIELAQRADELVIVGTRLDRKYVDGGAQQLAGFQCFTQGIDINHGTACGVDEDRILLDLVKLGGTHHVFGRGQFGYVQGHDVTHAQQFRQRADLFGIAQRQLGDHVIEEDIHAQTLSQYAQLGADAAIADDTQLLAADFVGVLRALEPYAAVGLGVLFRHAAQQDDRLGQHQLGYGAGVGVGRIEYGNTAFSGSLQVYLVGTDAEAAHGNQLLRRFEHLAGQLGAGADTDEVSIAHLFDQLFFGQ